MKLKKQHQNELTERLNEVSKVKKDLEQEIMMLKEMVRSVNMQLKSKDTDI